VTLRVSFLGRVYVMVLDFNPLEDKKNIKNGF